MSKSNSSTVPAPEKFGRLTVIEKLKWPFVRCRCDCGTVKVFRMSNLRSGNTVSCRCWQKERPFKHGFARRGNHHPDYKVWTHIIDRCCNPENADYEDYGARGITMCPRWRESFKNFHDDMGDRPPGLEIERINNDGNYEPGNCKWGTRGEQVRNTRRTNKIEYKGVTRCLTDWAKIVGVSRETLRWRIKTWGLEKAMETPRDEENSRIRYLR